MWPWIQKPEYLNRRLEPTGLATPGKTHWLRGTGTVLDCQEAAGQIFQWVWNRTDPFFQSLPEPLAGNQDLLLTLPRTHNLWFTLVCLDEIILYSAGIIPLALISSDFILTEMVCLIQIDLIKTSEVTGPGVITSLQIHITSRELSF